MKQLLIGITGPARTGKTTAARHLESEYGFESYAFAAPLKAGLAAMFNLDHEDIEGAGKERPIEWLGRSPRQLMQLLGTEWGRDMLSADIWIDLAHQNLGNLAELFPEAPGFVISDVRFENEADYIRKHGGLIIHMSRDDAPDVNPHASELGVALQPADLVILNNGEPADLFKKLDAIVSTQLMTAAAA